MLDRSDVDFVVFCEPEQIPFVGNCSAVDDATDRETETWIQEQLEAGNEWAWCSITVLACWGGYEGEASLGGCSYKSESDFTDCDDYYSDYLCFEDWADDLGYNTDSRKAEAIFRACVDSTMTLRTMLGERFERAREIAAEL